MDVVLINTYINLFNIINIGKMKILFVCNANLNRSPTFEKYFKKHLPQHEAKSAGIYYGYPHQLNEELMEWADKVFVMDYSQKKHIFYRYRSHYNKVEVIGISDEYDPDDKPLLDLIDFWLKEYIW